MLHCYISRKVKKHLQGHIERNHRTDDEEFYLSEHILNIKNKNDFINIATKCLYYYNVLRPSQAKYLAHNTPFDYAKSVIRHNSLHSKIDIDKLVRSFPILIDDVSVDITYFLNQLFAVTVQYVRGYYLCERISKLLPS